MADGTPGAIAPARAPPFRRRAREKTFWAARSTWFDERFFLNWRRNEALEGSGAPVVSAASGSGARDIDSARGRSDFESVGLRARAVRKERKVIA